MSIHRKIEELLHREGVSIVYKNYEISEVFLLNVENGCFQLYPYFGEYWLGNMNISKNDSLYELYLLIHKIQEKEMKDIVMKYSQVYDLLKYNGDISYYLKDNRIHFLYKEYSLFSLDIKSDDSYKADPAIGEFVYWLFNEVNDNNNLVAEACFRSKIKFSDLKESLGIFQRYITCLNETFSCESTNKWLEIQFEKNKDRKIEIA